MERNHRRSAGLRQKRIAVAVGAAFIQWMWVQPSWAGPSEPGSSLPTGGKWANNPDGSAGGTISTPSATQMQLNQNQRSGVVDFNCFCSRQGTLVNLTAPATDSTTLIRSQEGVNFWGRFTANDNVFITSSPGVYFSRTASVEVGSLFATSLSIANSDFFAGRYNFSRDGSAGSVVNDGVITVSGYAALAGPQVQNNGLIVAQAGTVALAAGDRVTLDMVGDGLIKVSVDAAALNALALNSGTIQADGGRVVLTARSANALLDTVINNTGIVRARSLVERNGEIVLEGGSAGVVSNSGALDASGTDTGTTGGTVTVHGQHVHLADGSSVDASGVAGGGTVTVKGDDTAYIYGSIDARGTGEGASGGSVETSGKYLEVTQAPDAGAGGTWLIDPYNIDVVAGSGTSNNGGSPSFIPSGDNSQIGAGLINGQLNSGANVVLDTGGFGSPGTQAGDIRVLATISKTVANPASLFLKAFHDVSVNAPISIAGGAVGLAANGSVTVNDSVFAAGGMNVTVAHDLNVIASPGRAAMLSTNGNQTISAANISLQAALSGNNGKAFIINTGATGDQTITVSGGSLTVAGGAGGLANQAGILSNGNQTINGNPQITLTGGASGTGSAATQTQNNAVIQTGGSGKTQTINAAAITAKAGAGNDAFAGITGANQTIVVSGDVQLTGGAGTGAPVARIGGLSGAAPGATNLFLSARDVILTGGDSATGEAGLGSTPIGTTPQPNTINVNATRDVILNGGTGGARIGTALSSATPAGGNISVTAGQGIQLNGATQPTAVRTAGNVSLAAGPGGISEGSNGYVQAGSLDVFSNGTANLAGPNQVSNFRASSGGDLSLNNTGALTVTGLNAGGNATLNNVGNVTLTGPLTSADVTFNTSGSISEQGAGAVVANSLGVSSFGTTNLTGPNRVASFNATVYTGDLALINNGALTVTGILVPGHSLTLANAGSMTLEGLGYIDTGVMNLNVAGDLSLAASGTQDARISAIGGQTINAQSLTVTAQNGHSAQLTNTGGNQSIIISGGGTSAGIDVQNLGGPVAFVNNNAPGGAQSITLIDGDHLAVNGRNGVAAINSNAGPQTISLTGAGANAVVVGSAGALGTSQISGRGQTLTAGTGTQSGSITIVGPAANGTNANIGVQPGSGAVAHTISTTGTLSVTGGSAVGSLNSGVFQNGTGPQSVTAADIVLQGGTSAGPSGGGAFISANIGTADQTINVTGGDITVTAGSVGMGNRAGIVTNGNQTINGNPDIVLTGGAGGTGSAAAGTSNGVLINANGAGKTQTINAGNITLTAGSGGNDAFAVMTGANQQITATGDVLLTGGVGSVGQSAVRIGGVAGATPTPTNLVLTARDLIVTGGDAAGNQAIVGSTPLAASQDNNITVNASRDVILNSGAGAGAGIGTALSFAAPAGGNISVTAGQGVQLNGATQPTAIRTTGNVSLTAGPGGISEGSNGYVQAGGLNVFSNGAVNLVGPNQVASFSGTTFGGDLALNNSGALDLSNVSVAGNAAIINAGDVSMTNSVNSGGTLTMNIAGAVKLDADATHDAFVTSNGQTINAQSLSITSRDGRVALLSSNGDQTVSIAGGSVDIANQSPFGVAQATSSGTQSIAVTDGDHIAVNGGGIFSSANQTLSITGSGANRISVGDAGTPRGSAIVAGRSQTITAGTGTENGSITITGPATSGTGISGFVTVSGVGAETQTISTSGTLRVTGGTAPAQTPNFNSGIFHNRQGRQSVTAADLVIEGGPGGANNGAFIATNGPAPNGAGPGGGDQEIHVSGSITLAGSSAGFNNRVSIFSNGNQTIDGDPDITITGGSAGGVAGLGNTAGISTAAGRQQTIRAGTLSVISGAGGIDASAFVTGGVQDIQATGDVLVTGGGSSGTRGGALIGGPGGGAVLQPTNLTLRVGRDLILAGGSGTNAVAAIGSSALGSGAPSNDITVTAGRDVILNSGEGAGARIGTSVLVPPTDGHLSITAGRNIELNGTAQPTVIRTAGSVELHAGGTISQAVNGFVVAGTLDTTSAGAQSLVGPNQVSRFTAEAASGDVALRNTAGVLTLGTMDLSGSLAIDQTGALSVPGTVAAGSQSIGASGDVLVGNATGSGPAGLFAPGAISIATPGSIVLRGSDTAFMGASIVAAGGLVSLNAGEVHLVAGAAPLAAATVLGGDVVTAVARDYTLTSGSGWGANALLFSASNIAMTIGGILTIDGGHTPGNWARIQTATRDGTITLNFPNLDSGGFFVDGFEGKIKHGQDGFFTGTKPAKLGDTLQLIYGL